MHGEGKHRIQLAGEKLATIMSATVERKHLVSKIVKENSASSN